LSAESASKKILKIDQ